MKSQQLIDLLDEKKSKKKKAKRKPEVEMWLGTMDMEFGEAGSSMQDRAREILDHAKVPASAYTMKDYGLDLKSHAYEKIILQALMSGGVLASSDGKGRVLFDGT